MLFLRGICRFSIVVVFWIFKYLHSCIHTIANTRAFSERDSEVKSSRLTDEELKRIQEEHAKKEAALSELRKERAIKMKEEMKQRELEEAAPKARSALAARWEEQVRSRSGGGKLNTSQNKATVMSDVSP